MKEEILELHKIIKDKKSKGINCDIEINLLIGAFDDLINCIVLPYFAYGADKDDLIQEGRLGLVKAIETFDETKKISFVTYASTCIKNSVFDLIRKQNSSGNKLINASISINDLKDDAKLDLKTPEDIMIEKEFMENIKSKLNKYQIEVLDLYLDGYSYEQIAHQLNRTTKSIDNCIQKIKRTIKVLKY